MPLDRPNLALIVLDSARADRFGCYGYARPTTPAIDRLAAEGLVCEAMITQGPWTLPSHGSLFTGLYPAEHGAQWQTGMRLSSSVEVTLAELLRRHGYRTLSVSENPLITEVTGLTRGFDEIVIRSSAEKKLERAVRRVKKATALGGAGGDRVTAMALDRLRTAPGRPFFLFVNYLECHWAYTPDLRFERAFLRDGRSWAESVWARYRESLRIGPWEAVARADGRTLRRLNDLYDASLRTADRMVAELLEGLRQLGVLEQTLVIVASDHGEHIGDHGLADHHASLADTLVRVPFIVWNPRRVPARRVEGQFEFVDVLPSLAELLQLPVPDGLRDTHRADILADGGKPYAFSEWRRWTDAELAGLQRRNPSYDFSAAAGNLLAVRTPRHKLVLDDRRGEFLFDLRRDPRETVNVADGQPEVAAELRAVLADQRARWEGTLEPGRAAAYSEADSAEIERRLADLGYI